MENFTTDTSNMTPIEVLLQVGTDGTVSAKNVYAFLELNPSNYAKWCRNNITENEFAEENVDFTEVVLEYETPTGGKATTKDYKLSVSFAKKLCMQQKNERGEQARNYFVMVEDAFKRFAQTRLHQPYDTVKAFGLGEVSNLLKLLVSVMNKQNSTGREIAEQVKLTCGQFGIQTIADFVKPSHYEQLALQSIKN